MKTRFLPCNSEFFKGWYFRRRISWMSDSGFRDTPKSFGICAGLADMDAPLFFKTMKEFRAFAIANPPSKYRAEVLAASRN